MSQGRGTNNRATQAFFKGLRSKCKAIAVPAWQVLVLDRWGWAEDQSALTQGSTWSILPIPLHPFCSTHTPCTGGTPVT